ncbi:O-antigen ligase family protein [Candidatus Woesebacteria bacterium]|nr:O-antigen ligase family protein [Candidatus Woesebacteria bacterium]
MEQTMDVTKRKIIEWLIFVFFVIFPFGQLFRVGILSGLDVTAGLFLVIYLVTRPKTPIFHKFSRNFFWAAVFSLVMSFFLFASFGALYGGLYLLRLVSYYALFVVVWNTGGRIKNKLFGSLLAVSLVVAVFGWIQYFLYPDLTSLKEWGWDDHLYRLVGTFLDPTFTGIILTFGFLMAVALYFAKKEKKLLLLALFFLISVGFTYSRASYLALLAGSSVIFFLKKSLKGLLLTAAILLVLVFFLPKGVGEGEKLGRVRSIYARLTNYVETVQIFQKSPIFGVGFNNICLAKQLFLKEINTASHACGGSDSSLLLILATTGVVGGFMFARMGLGVAKDIKRNTYGIAFFGCLAALFVHSLFSNSLFYPWVMGYMAILLAIKE